MTANNFFLKRTISVMIVAPAIRAGAKESVFEKRASKFFSSKPLESPKTTKKKFGNIWKILAGLLRPH